MADTAPILVTGGTGAIGRFVVQHLRDQGHTALPLSRHAPPDGIAADITDVDRLTEILARHRVARIIHLAATLLDSEAHPHRAFTTNTGGTAAVLEAARRVGVERLVHVSTKAALGPFTGPWGYPSYRPVQEDHPRHPCMTYGVTKAMAEHLAEHYRERYGVPVVMVRFATTIGTGKGSQHGRTATTGAMIENAVRGLPTVLPAGGDERDDILYNPDVAQGIVLVALTEGITSNLFHLGSGTLVNHHDIAAAIRAEIPGADITIGPGLDYMGLGVGNYCLMSTARAQHELGFRPRYALQDWVRDYIAVTRAAHPS